MEHRGWEDPGGPQGKFLIEKEKTDPDSKPDLLIANCVTQASLASVSFSVYTCKMGHNTIYQIGFLQGFKENNVGKVLTVGFAYNNMAYLLSAFIWLTLV